MKTASLVLFFVMSFAAVTNAAAPRPTAADGVQISQFSAARIQDLITLNWNTLGERNNLGFEIERKSQFEEKWQTVGYLRGRGTAAGSKDYAFVERLSSTEVVLYRIKQIDVSGSFLYSQAVTVTPDQFRASMLVSPVADHPSVEYNRLSFALPADCRVSAAVHDVYGRKVHTISDGQRLDAGYHVIPFGSASLAPGVYSVRLVTDAGTFVRTFTKR